MSPTGDITWIFGYGSLMWRPDFKYLDRRTAWVEGWARRLWQGSTDHRGIPGSPGRVVTLTRSPGAQCWGIAYSIDGALLPAILDRLDFREQGGYERIKTKIYSPEAEPVSGLLYIAGPGNRNYLGEATVQEISKQAIHASGPSGHNADYLHRLAESIRALGATDKHVFEVEKEMKRLKGAENTSPSTT